MKIKINTKIIEDLKPCSDRYDNWLDHYRDFDGDILEFLELENISAADKIWVSVRVLPRFLVEVFVIDCAFFAAAYAADADAAATVAATAADYAVAANYAANYAVAANYAANYAAPERETQVDALIWLIENEGGGE